MSNHYKIHGEHSRDKYIIAAVLMGLIIVGLISVWLMSAKPNSGPVPSGVDTSVPSASSTTGVGPEFDLARCLTDKKVVMYGASWCSHCADQKKSFGQAWPLVTYVECTTNTKLCLAKKVEGYPSWIKADGGKLEGFTELKDLATWAECPF